MSGVDFMNGFMGKMLDSINTCIIGEINSFEPTKMKATVKPLVNAMDGKNKSLLIEVPVAFIKTEKFFIRPPYKPGDLVIIVFSDDDIDNAIMTGSTSDPATPRKHSLDDGIVVGGIMAFNGELEGEFEDADLVIQGENNSIVMAEGGDITIKGKDIKIIGDNVMIQGSNNTGSW